MTTQSVFPCRLDRQSRKTALRCKYGPCGNLLHGGPRLPGAGEGDAPGLCGKRRMQTSREKLEGCFIVCGFGRIGSMPADETMREGRPVAVIAAAHGWQGAAGLEGLHQLETIP
ncbi:MAG: hypothetical protein ACOCVM_05805 [Desulfovibrionaceae bacterium]